METQQHTVKVNLCGGVVSAGDLYEILLIAQRAGATEVCFGTRQQLFFNINSNMLEDLEYGMLAAAINYELNADQRPNMVSSYVADTIFNSEGWLTEGVYKDIFDLFTHQPQVKINLVDSSQTFVPFFTGNLNFISSAISNYWYLYVRFPKTNQICCCPVLIYSDDIPEASKKIEQLIFHHKDEFYEQLNVNELRFFELLKERVGFSQPVTDKLILPDFQLPYYEGFNKHGNKLWLGIYRRNEYFSIDFLTDVCQLCLQTRIGQLYITPWKSLLIKNIDNNDKSAWGRLLNKHRLNVRHAANELNWQTEDQCREGLELKKQLVREFEEADLRTYRLCFAIKTQARSGLFGSIILKKRDADWDVMYTRDFNPNSKDFVTYKKRVPRNGLSKSLEELCQLYYNFYSDNEPDIAVTSKAENTYSSLPDTKQVYQCIHCLSIYDEAYGDDLKNIPAGTDFNALDVYDCPVCSAPKQDFVPINWSVTTQSL